MIDRVTARNHTGARRPYVAGWPEKGVLAGSLLAGMTGVLWWLRPHSYPFGPQDRFADLSLMTHVPVGAAIVLILATGGAGTVLAGLLVAGRGTTLLGRVSAIAVAAFSTTVFGFLVPDIQVLILTAYLMTLGVPASMVAVLTTRLLSARWPRATTTAAISGVAAGSGTFVTLLAGLCYVARDAEPIGYRPLVVFGSLAIGVGWGIVLIRLLRYHRHQCQNCGRPGAAWTSPTAAASWGRILTWATALCPLPYVVTRLSWLTPWPVGASADTLAHHPGLRVFGLTLALAGEGGTWLTLGLIRPRGEIFPRSLPLVGGRPVPVMAAVIPGLVVALMMCISGHSLMQQSFGPGTDRYDHLLVLLMPFPIWGPLLAAATLAYWYRRRPECRRCGSAATSRHAEDVNTTSQPSAVQPPVGCSRVLSRRQRPTRDRSRSPISSQEEQTRQAANLRGHGRQQQ